MHRFFFAGAAEAAPDKQGRIMLPAPLIEHAKLGREVVVAGVYDHLEIWDRETWRAQMRDVEGSAEHVAERLATRRD
jgi:MraZ protein